MSPRLRIAFVACQNNRQRMRQDPSFIYRCENMASALEQQGHQVRVIHVSHIAMLPRQDFVVFHRPKFSLRLYLACKLLRRRGDRMIADFDDLIFDPKLAKYSPGVLNRHLSLSKTQWMFSRHNLALALFDAFTVSTKPLAQHLSQLSPRTPTQVIPNSVHMSWFQAAEKMEHFPSQRKYLSYFSGTRSHDHDFAMISRDLEAILNQFDQLHLTVMGPLQYRLHTDPSQLSHIEKKPFPVYSKHVGQSWLNLAPLCSNPFNDCKSALKIIEAGFWGIPTLCSRFPDSERFHDAGAIFAESPSSWQSHIERCLLDESYYKRITQDLRRKVLELAHPLEISQRLSDFYWNLA